MKPECFGKIHETIIEVREDMDQYPMPGSVCPHRCDYARQCVAMAIYYKIISELQIPWE